MVTPKKLKTPPPAEDALVDNDDLYSFDSMGPKLQEIAAAMGIDGELNATAFVYKVDAAAKRNPLVWSGPPEQYDLAQVARQHGSGEYRFILYAYDREGIKARRMDVTLAYRLTATEEAQLNAAILAAQNPTLPDDAAGDRAGLGEIKEMMRGMMQANADMLRGIVEMHKAPPVDPLIQMEKLAGVMKTMMPAPAAHNPQGDFMGFLTMVKTFNDVTGVGKTAVPEGADPSTALMMKAIDAFGPALAEGIKSRGPVPDNTPPPALPSPPAPIPAPSADAGAQTLTAEQEEDLMLFKLQLRAANKAAGRGADAAQFADTIYAMLPDDALASLVMDANWFAYLCQAESGCAQFEAWYKDVREALITMGIEDGDIERDAQGNLQMAPESDILPANESITAGDNGVVAGSGN